ncbi:MAG: hydratase, partial [Lachnospiraceae bacterium]|nr:hydratase [Lachnospiraceae bacterium]
NPIALSEFALSRRVPEYVGLSKKVRALEEQREQGQVDAQMQAVLNKFDADAGSTTIGSCVYANRPGDGSAREQAASCQKVLGGFANIAHSYATKRYRSNCINWGIVPFTFEGDFTFESGDWIYVPGIKEGILNGQEEFAAKAMNAAGEIKDIKLQCIGLSSEEKQIVTDGCLMNYYAANNK